MIISFCSSQMVTRIKCFVYGYASLVSSNMHFGSTRNSSNRKRSELCQRLIIFTTYLSNSVLKEKVIPCPSSRWYELLGHLTVSSVQLFKRLRHSQFYHATANSHMVPSPLAELRQMIFPIFLHFFSPILRFHITFGIIYAVLYI